MIRVGERLRIEQPQEGLDFLFAPNSQLRRIVEVQIEDRSGCERQRRLQDPAPNRARKPASQLVTAQQAAMEEIAAEGLVGPFPSEDHRNLLLRLVRQLEHR